ncbi:MAG: S8 family serine peptidase [Clostridia bacterium]|nr:S8 family serine peptidase [Clostridia bacterium]
MNKHLRFTGAFMSSVVLLSTIIFPGSHLPCQTSILPKFDKTVADIDSSAEYVSNRVLLTADKNFMFDELDDIVVDSEEIIADEEFSIYEITVSDSISVKEAMNLLGEQQGTLYVEPDYYIDIQPMCCDMLGEIVSNANRYQWQHEAVHTYDAWELMLNVPTYRTRVAILDTMVDIYHSDVSSNINKSLSCDYSSGTKVPITRDNYEKYVADHGTHVAGIIGADSMNGIGIEGVASGRYSGNVELVCINLSKDKLRITQTHANEVVDDMDEVESSNIIKAINYAADCGCKVCNMSFGLQTSKRDYAIESAVNSAYRRGMICVCSSGNDASTQCNQLSYAENVICVGALDYSNNKLVRSYYSCYGANLDICAPGTSIYSSVCNNGYRCLSGTSMATPIVTGVLSLMFAVNPSLPLDTARDILLSSATDVGTEGWDIETGYGCVNAYEAIWQTIKLIRPSALPNKQKDVKGNITEEVISSPDLCLNSSELYVFAEGYLDYSLNLADLRSEIENLCLGQISLCDYYQSFINSKLFLNNIYRPLSDAEYIKAIYKIFLYKDISDREVANMISNRRNSWSRDPNYRLHILRDILNSNDFYANVHKLFPNVKSGDAGSRKYDWNR